MAVNGKSRGRVADEAQRHSDGVTNDFRSGRMTDADLTSSDGMALEDRDEWNMEKMSRRGQWKDPSW